MSSLYIHIPFCRTRCLYCSFTSYPGLSSLHADYISALKSELRSIREVHGKNTPPLKTLFVGGGTPTALAAELLCGLIEYILDLFEVEKKAEITTEANPGTVDSGYLKSLGRAGVNRISFGVQSFSDRELAAIGRVHNGREAVEVVQSAQDAGFKNINIDLMYGLPTQTGTSWRKSLTTAMDLGVQHLSMYQLTVEEGTPIFRTVEAGDLVLPGEARIENMDLITRELCRRNGFQQYEISNFCRAGFACKHNTGYWLNNEYLAAGVSAVSYFAGVREKRVSSVEEYLARVRTGGSVILEREELDREGSFRETVIMGLRLTEGVSLHHLQKRYSMEPVSYYGRVVTDLVEAGYLEVTESHMRITGKGRPVSNQVMSRLV